MDTETLTHFFMWCSIINAGIGVVWGGGLLLAPDRMYRLHNRLFPMRTIT